MTMQSPGPARPKKPWWPLRWWGWVALGAVGLAAVGIVEYQWYAGQRDQAVAAASASAKAAVEAEAYGPQALVSQYLGYLAEGEVTQAWALATGLVTYRDAGQTPLALTQDHAEPLLTNLLYANLDAHPSDAEIAQVRQLTSGRAQVEVTYQLGGQEVAATFQVRSVKQPGGGATWWEFDAVPLATVSFPAQQTAGTWTVAGVDLATVGAPTSGEPFTALAAPGTYDYTFTPAEEGGTPVAGTLEVKDGTEELSASG